MENLLSLDLWLGAGLIFILRLLNMAVDTVRALMVMRGRKPIVWLLGFIQTMIYVVVLNTIIQDLGNWINLLMYAAGFASGNVIGMGVEERMALGHAHVQIISTQLGTAIAERLRQDGYAVTEFSGRGRDGTVTLISAAVLRKNIEIVRSIVEKVDESAFISAENLNPIRRGYWRLK